VTCECSTLQATPGKVVMNVWVQPVTGERVGLRAAALRNALRLVDLQPCLAYSVGAVAALRSPLRQRVGDRVARTWVAQHRFDPADRIACLLVLTAPVAFLVRSYHRRPRLPGPAPVAPAAPGLTG